MPDVPASPHQVIHVEVDVIDGQLQTIHSSQHCLKGSLGSVIVTLQVSQYGVQDCGLGLLLRKSRVIIILEIVDNLLKFEN